MPRLSDLLANTSTLAEKLPTVDRNMRFRATVRDNRVGGGGVDWDERTLTVDASSGPFRVTAPGSVISTAGDLTVTWDVAGTDVAPVSASEVNILLSTDGGSTFPTTLIANTPNDGSETVTIPNLDGGVGLVKVEAVDNIFFALSGSCLRPSRP